MKNREVSTKIQYQDVKTLIFKIVLFLTILVLFNFLYLEYLKKYDMELSKGIRISKMKNEDFACVILGNSVVLDGIDAGYLTQNGVSAYNFALGGANMETSYIQLSKFIKYNKTKCAVLGLSPGRNYKTFIPPPLHPVVEYSYDLMDKWSIRSMPVIKFQWLAIETFKNVVSKDHRNATDVLGQLRTEKTIPDYTNYPEQTTEQISLDDFVKANYLFKIDSLCDANDIDFLVIDMPGYKDTQNHIPFGLHVLRKDDIEINYINFNNKQFCAETFDTQKDWLGNSHLNQYGAVKLTEHLYRECVNYKAH